MFQIKFYAFQVKDINSFLVSIKQFYTDRIFGCNRNVLLLPKFILFHRTAAREKHVAVKHPFGLRLDSSRDAVENWHFTVTELMKRVLAWAR